MASSTTLTIRLDKDLERLLDRQCKRTGQKRSDIVRDALRRELSVRRFEDIRRRTLPFAEARGYLTDEDVISEGLSTRRRRGVRPAVSADLVPFFEHQLITGDVVCASCATSWRAASGSRRIRDIVTFCAGSGPQTEAAWSTGSRSRCVDSCVGGCGRSDVLVRSRLLGRRRRALPFPARGFWEFVRKKARITVSRRVVHEDLHSRDRRPAQIHGRDRSLPQDHRCGAFATAFCMANPGHRWFPTSATQRFRLPTASGGLVRELAEIGETGLRLLSSPVDGMPGAARGKTGSTARALARRSSTRMRYTPTRQKTMAWSAHQRACHSSTRPVLGRLGDMDSRRMGRSEPARPKTHCEFDPLPPHPWHGILTCQLASLGARHRSMTIDNSADRES